MVKRKSVFLLCLLIVCILPDSFICFSQTVQPEKKVKSLLVTEENFLDGSASVLKEIEVKYDVSGNVIEEIKYKEGKIDKHFKYEYDAENNKIREIEYNKKGSVDKITEYKYKDGLRIEKSVYDAQKNLKSRKKYDYKFY